MNLFYDMLKELGVEGGEGRGVEGGEGKGVGGGGGGGGVLLLINAFKPLSV